MYKEGELVTVQGYMFGFIFKILRKKEDFVKGPQYDLQPLNSESKEIFTVSEKSLVKIKEVIN